MLQMSRMNGKVLLLSVVTVGLLGSCMQDHSNGGDYISHPYLKDGFYSDGKLFYDMDQTTASVVGSDGGASEVIIPDAIEINEMTYPVGRIKNLGVFKNPDDYGQFGVTSNTGLSSLQLSATVAAIQSVDQKKDVFYEPLELTARGEDVYLPTLALGAPLKRRYPIKTVVVRSGNPTYDAREGCNSLIHYATGRVVFAGLDAKVPPAIKSITPCAYVGCELIDKDCKLSAGLVEIGYSAFQNCALTSLVLPSSLETIGMGAFFGNHLREITIPAAVTDIGDYAFADNDLSALVVEAGNEVYDSRDNCNAIIETESNELLVGCDNTVIPAAVRLIRPCAFYGSTRLSAIQLPDSLESIGDYAFMNCISLDAAVIPNTTRYIGKSAFYGCKKLTKVELPANVAVGEGAFRNCDGLTLHEAYVKVAFDDPSLVDPSVFGFSEDQKANHLMVPEEAENRFMESAWRNYFLSITGY